MLTAVLYCYWLNQLLVKTQNFVVLSGDRMPEENQMVSTLDVCPIDIEGMEFGPTSDQMRKRQSVSTCDSAMSQASKLNNIFTKIRFRDIILQ